MNRVKVTAAKRGTFVSAATGRIHHFDPNGSDRDARHPTVDMRDIDDLKSRGLIGERAKGSAVEATEAPVLDDKTLERLATAAAIDEKAGVVASPAAAVALTNYPPSMNVGGDESGLRADDPDAAPVGGGAPKALQPAADPGAATKPAPKPAAPPKAKAAPRRAPSRSGSRRATSKPAAASKAEGGADSAEG